jgi:hypothetical protein
MKLITELFDEVEILTESTDSGKKYTISGIFAQAEKLNRNKRVYPRDILEREINNHVEEKVLSNIGYGELSHPCFWNKTKALTEFGWKYIKDITIGEMVYTINIDTNSVELNKVLDVHVNHYKGKLLNFKNRTFDTVVTPNHRFLLQHRYGQNLYKTAKELYDEFDTPSVKKLKILKVSNGLNIDVSDFVIPGIPSSRLKIYREDLHLNMYHFSGFMGIYLSEGCVLNQKNKTTKTIGIYQNVGENSDKIKICLDNLGIPYYIKTIGIKNQFIIKDQRLAHWLHKLGICYTKYIPQEFIKNINAECGEYFLDMFILGDGRKSTINGYSKRDCFSTSEKLIDGISVITTICGIAHRIYKFVPTKDVYIEGRLIKAENKSPLYFLQFLNSKGVYIDDRHMHIDEVDWDDNVYCLEVENNSNFYAMDGGYTFWTGNSHFHVNPDRISHRITELRFDGNDVYGKANILDNACGKILESIIKDGGKFGMSTRAIGTIKKNSKGLNEVQQDLKLSCIDAVIDPSGIDCWVEGILENKIFDIVDGVITESIIDNYKQVIKKSSTKELNEIKFKLFQDFMNNLKNK